MLDSIKLLLVKYAEAVQVAALLGLIIAMWFAMGCSHTCPVPEVITKPVPVEVPRLVKTPPLSVCHAPEYAVCDQETILDRVRCVGENHQRLIQCHEENVAAIGAYNEAIAD
jgi:hypothetical protein